MRIQKNKIVKLYPTVSDDVIEYMYKVHQFLTDKYGSVKPEWTAILKELAKSKDYAEQLEKKIDDLGLMVKDRYGNLNKNPLFSVLSAMYIRVEKALSELGLTPKSSGLIVDSRRESDEDKDKEKESDYNDFIATLTSPITDEKKIV